MLLEECAEGGSIGKIQLVGNLLNRHIGIVNGADVDSYIRVENNGDITLEARGGSIGELAYEKDKDGNFKLDEQGKKIVSRYENNGVRILNSPKASSSNADANVGNVILRAQDNVYVTGVASFCDDSPASGACMSIFLIFWES